MTQIDIEAYLSARDLRLGELIDRQSERWPISATEYPIWGLIRIVIAQQVSTHVACSIADRLKTLYPTISTARSGAMPGVAGLRALGLPERRAKTCVEILTRSEEIVARVDSGELWESALQGIKGIGPWTIATFRIMVLRHPDVLPLGDVGLERAVRKAYGEQATASDVSEKWRPYRSVACWYLWRTLGNKQLG